MVADARRRIGIHAKHARLRKKPADLFDHPFRSDAELSYRFQPTGRTDSAESALDSRSNGSAAIVRCGGRIERRCSAGSAASFRSYGRAMRPRYHDGSRRANFFHRASSRSPNACTSALLKMLRLPLSNSFRRSTIRTSGRGGRSSFAQLQQPNSAAFRRSVTLKRRRGAAEQQYSVFALHSLARRPRQRGSAARLLVCRTDRALRPRLPSRRGRAEQRRRCGLPRRRRPRRARKPATHRNVLAPKAQSAKRRRARRMLPRSAAPSAALARSRARARWRDRLPEPGV